MNPRWVPSVGCALVMMTQAHVLLGASRERTYTLGVETDRADVVSFDALAAPVAAELHAPVQATTAGQRPAIEIVYRRDRLLVRAHREDGTTVEREIAAAGDAAAVRREAVLLVGNLARDEAGDVLAEMASRETEPRTAPPREVPPRRDAVVVSVLYPLATNAGQPNVQTPFSFSLFYGRVSEIEGVDFSSGVAYASKRVHGVELGAIGAFTGETHGAQWGGLGAVASDVHGVQLGGFGSIAQDLRGVQLGGFGSIARDLRGVQLGGLGSIASGEMHGVQLAGVGAVATGNVHGVQVAGGGNVAAASLDGAQVATLNVAGDVQGVQVGMVNVGRRVSGLQFGLINVAEEIDGAGVGVVTIARDTVHPVVWTSNLAWTNAGIKFVTKYAYTVVAATMGTHETGFSPEWPGVFAALGSHVPLGDMFDVDAEVGFSHLELESPRNANQAVHARVLPGIRVARHLRFFAGGGARLPVSFEEGREVPRPEGVAGVQF